MHSPDAKPTAPLIASCIVLAVLGIYVGGYFALGDRIECNWPTGNATRIVCFPSAWLALAYRPLALLETKLSGTETQSDRAPVGALGPVTKN
jgi:hypothetical protein